MNYQVVLLTNIMYKNEIKREISAIKAENCTRKKSKFTIIISGFLKTTCTVHGKLDETNIFVLLRARYLYILIEFFDFFS